jgi:hypothetical protein
MYNERNPIIKISRSFQLNGLQSAFRQSAAEIGAATERVFNIEIGRDCLDWEAVVFREFAAIS